MIPGWLEKWGRNRPRSPAVRGIGRKARNESGKRNKSIPGTPVVPGERPAYLGALDTAVGDAIEAAAAPAFSWAEFHRLCSALAAIPADLDGRTWASYGRAIHGLGWGSMGFELWDRWSSTSRKEKPDGGAYEGRDKLARRWQGWDESGPDFNGVPITVASIYKHAIELGWSFASHVSNVTTNNVNGIPSADNVLPAQITANPIRWSDIDSHGHPKPTCENTRVALRYLGVQCRYDLFHHRQYVNGQTMEQWQGELADDTVLAVRSMIRANWKLDPPSTTARDALIMECQAHAYDPVLDYMDGLVWDRRDRLATWLHDYLGAEDTPLNRMIGGLSLVAAVRRARRPGAKFDHVIVLEGLEGMGKSSAVAIMAGTENFSDQEILTLNDRAQQEQVQGVWLYEIAELAGMHRADIERVKAFVTRTVDRARPAYGHHRVDRPRRCVFFASCNNEHYLLAQTGNRRFWPVRCAWVRMDELHNARDQLWAQASMVEKRGVSLALPESFWPAAAQIQESRRVRDPWEDRLFGIEHEDKNVQKHKSTGGQCEWRITTLNLMGIILGIPDGQQTTMHTHRLGNTMRLLGWEGPKTIRMRIVENDDRTRTFKGFSKRCDGESR